MKKRLKADEMSIVRNSKVTKSSGQWLVASGQWSIVRYETFFVSR